MAQMVYTVKTLFPQHKHLKYYPNLIPSHVNDEFALTENVVEEVAVIVVGLKPLVKSWTSLHMNKKKLIIDSSSHPTRTETPSRGLKLYSQRLFLSFNETMSKHTHADFGVDVPVIQLLVEDQEHRICIRQNNMPCQQRTIQFRASDSSDEQISLTVTNKRSDGFCLWPWRSLKEAFCQLVPAKVR